MDNEFKTCQKCGKTMKIDQFYQRKDGSKMDLCKKCLTMHIDNFNPETFLWILEDMDIPYVPVEWNVLRDRAFAKNPNLNGMSVFGKYLSKMKLKQWKDYGWADSEKLQAINEERNKIVAMQRQEYEDNLKKQLESGDISEAQYKTLVSTSTQNQEQMYIESDVDSDYENPYGDGSAFIPEEDLIDVGEKLTKEDKIYLAMKWGRLYKPIEWVELEKTYKEMMESFDIQDADTRNTLVTICKTYLKMNQAIDQGDVEGFQKFSKVYNELRKSAKFTAAQNKEQKEDFVDSVGELITLCERDGFIPRFTTDIPQDKVDATLKDMNEYVRKLVTQDLGFGQQIEDAIKKIQIQQAMQEDVETGNTEVEDEDFEEFYEEISAQKEQDNLLIEEESDE